MKVVAVVPTCRGFKIPQQTIPVEWVIVHDRQEWPIDGNCENIIAPDEEMYGSRCSCIRSAGFMHAYKMGATHILTCDDDVLLPVGWAEDHVIALESNVHPWSDTVKDALNMRGVPYNAPRLPIAVSHGLWSNVPDLDGKTQLAYPNYRIHLENKWSRIYPPFAMSSMNFGFRREVMPVMYQPAMGDGWPFKRHDDIWLGVLAQRVLTLHDYAFMNGGAVVWHTRASDAASNAVAEEIGAKEHEDFWKWVWGFGNKGATIANTYLNLADYVKYYESNSGNDVYFSFLARNMRRWIYEITK